MRTAIAILSVSVLTLLSANSRVGAQCATGLPDFKHSPCFEVHIDGNVQASGVLESHDELMSDPAREAPEQRFKTPSLSANGRAFLDSTYRAFNNEPPASDPSSEISSSARANIGSSTRSSG
jgi:hypothetical protein